MKAITFLLLLPLALACAVQASQAEPVYKWVDAQGNVHYSDKPHPGAKKVRIAKPQSYSAPALPNQNRETSARPPSEEKVAPRQYSLVITHPAAGVTLHNTRSVTVSVRVLPALASGDTLIITLDGKSSGPLHTVSTTFDDLDRGTHTITAALTTAQGQTVQASPVTFYLRQATVFHGKPPL